MDADPGTKSQPRFRWRTLLVALAVVVAGSCWWRCDLRHRLIAKRWGVVEPHAIFRSGQISRHLVQPMLEQNQVQVVIDLTDEDLADADQQAEQAAIHTLGISYHRIPLIGDGTGDIRNYARALETLVQARDSGRRVLVHCSAGSQRTGGVIAAYRLLFQQADRNAVLEELRLYDWQPERDAVLLDYLDAHWRELAELLVARKLLARLPAELPHLSSASGLSASPDSAPSPKPATASRAQGARRN